jgi:hypothetical protein
MMTVNKDMLPALFLGLAIYVLMGSYFPHLRELIDSLMASELVFRVVKLRR